jgi:hypothetical protein
MRSAAIFRFVNFVMAVTPGMPFQISTSRLIGHSAANSASSLWLVKGSNGVANAAAASFLLANTLMLLLLSIVNVFM